MPNITLSVEDEVIKKVRKIAIDKNTTLTALVRDFLKSVANQDAQQKDIVVAKLRKSFQTVSRNMGNRKWTREILHER
jgi:uncharacterized NAD(P)/FAD-binding protein YdhS